jgi:threonine/homoserine efflux transporter RhtA
MMGAARRPCRFSSRGNKKIYNRYVLADAIEERHESKTDHKPLRLKTFLMILVMVVTGPLGNVLLGRGMKHAGAVVAWPPSELLHTGLRVFTSTSIWLGISSLILFFVSYMLVLSWADYSFVQPASSLAYGVVALLGYLILGESVSPMRWLGIAIICLGVFVISHTAPRTTTQQTAREN